MLFLKCCIVTAVTTGSLQSVFSMKRMWINWN